MNYNELLDYIKKSECAKLHKNSNLVIGRGSRNPKVVFVGEAPGLEEDRQKMPFVGRSGQLLNKWIEYLGLSEDDYYITNVLKTRPPNNRDPTPEEVKLCLPILELQLKVLNPEIIVCVGRFAMKSLVPDSKSILKVSGRLIGNKYVVPHPSYFLRRGGVGWEPYLKNLKLFLDTRQKRL